MVILVDRYGNEKQLEIPRESFLDAGGDGGPARRPDRKVAKKAMKAATKPAAKKTTRSRRG